MNIFELLFEIIVKHNIKNSAEFVILHRFMVFILKYFFLQENVTHKEKIYKILIIKNIYKFCQCISEVDAVPDF